MLKPLTPAEARRINRINEISQSGKVGLIEVCFYDKEGDAFYRAEMSPELLKSICDFALDRNENFTKAWRNSYGKRGG